MKNGKYARSAKMNKKPLILMAALLLVVGIATGSTLAWLMDTTDAVENTFTTSDVSIKLTESDNLNLEMIPGHTITKDPKVTVEAASEACFVFVKLEKTADYDSFMEYAMADGWTAMTGETGVFYREVQDTDADQEFVVIKDNKIKVKDSVTKEMMAYAKTNAQKLTITAYSCQSMKDNTTKFTAAEAWANCKDVAANPTAYTPSVTPTP